MTRSMAEWLLLVGAASAVVAYVLLGTVIVAGLETVGVAAYVVAVKVADWRYGDGERS